MNATPCARHHGSTSSSRSRVHSDSSDWTDATGWIACAASSCSTVASDSPIARALPAATTSAMRAPGLLERHVLVDAVQLVEVDVVGAEPAAATRRCPRARAPGGRRGTIAVGRDVLDHEADLRGEHDLVAAAGERGADDLLVRERPVHVGGVDQRHAELDRAVDRRRPSARRRARRVVGPRHAHAAEADRARRRAARAEPAPRQLGSVVMRPDDRVASARMQVRVRLGAGLSRLAARAAADRRARRRRHGRRPRTRACATPEPDLAPALRSALPVVGGEHVPSERPLAHREEVALLLPVSGG